MQNTTAKNSVTSVNTTLPPKTTTAITTSKPPAAKPTETDAIITIAYTEPEPVEITETATIVTESVPQTETEETTAYTETTAAEFGSGENDIGGRGADPNLIILIILIILAALGGAGYYFWKKRNGASSKTSAEKTAQEFINVRDTGDNCLYTVDEKVFVYLKIDGMQVELFEDEELTVMSDSLAAALGGVRFPIKFSIVSKPMELKTTLQKYTDLQQNATAGHKALLDQEISELVAMAERGETKERQLYAGVWGNESDEETVKRNADDLLKLLTDNGISAEILDKDGIAELCNVVNNPAYSHLENNWDFGDDMFKAITL